MRLYTYKESILFQVAEEVSEAEFGDDLERHVSNMAVLMYGSKGVGLAGPQVGDTRRILVADLGYARTSSYGKDLVKMVNPTVVSSSNDSDKVMEGCLSYPGLMTRVERPTSIVISYRTPAGAVQQEEYSGFAARIIQHEMDHLKGITLYTRSSGFAKKQYEKKLKKTGLLRE